MTPEKLAIFDEIVGANPNFDRKGKNMIYTSANGYMFSLLNKDDEIGVRLSPASQKAFKEKYNATEYRSHGAVMRDYVHIPDGLLSDRKLMAELFEESYQYVMSLPPKKGKK